MGKYKKKDFTVLPNKEKRRGLSPFLQTVYTWLCDHSDDDMKSFPSRKTLSYECGMSVRTLDRSMQELVRLGLVVKSARYNNNEQSTNFYEVVLFAEGGDTDARGSVTESLGGDRNSTQNSNHLTQTIKLNSNKLELAKPKEFGNLHLNEVFVYWKETTGLPITAQVKANRFAANNLLKKYGIEKLHKLIDGVALARGDTYAPRIANFSQLQAKVDDLLVWGNKEVRKPKGIKI